jgi:hypothetical protein
LTDAEWKSDRFRFVFDWDTFLRADVDTLSAVADRNVKATIWNPNEARAYLGYPPREGGEVYGSPAINPRPEDGKDAPDNGRPRNSAHRELLHDRILHFLERDAISVKQAASGAKNFVKWLDEFYGGDERHDGAEPKIVALCDTILGPSVRACCAAGLDARGIATAVANYAKTRHALLLEACSHVTKDELPAVIEKLAGENTSLVAQGLLATALGEINGS